MSEAEAPSWALYEAFLAVMEGGSLSAASRALRVAQPTIRRHVERLEELLGVVLFTRARNGLVPTDVARATLPYAQAIAASARAFVRSASAAEDRGTVRVAASEVVGAEVLPAMLAALARAHPAIHLELVLSNRNEDLVRRDADLAVRMARPTQAGLVARHVGAVEVGLFASPAYLATHPAPTKLAQLRDHALIGGDRERGTIDALGQAGLATRSSDYALRTDNQLAQLAAVRAGVGIGPCQVPLATGLVRVLPRLGFPLHIWLVMHEDLRGARRVRTVFDHLVTTLGAYVG